MLWVMERWGSRLSVESWQLCWQFPASGKSECCWGGDGLRWVSGLGSWLDQHPFGNHGSLAEVWTTLCLHYHPQTLGFPCRFPCLLPSSLGGMQGWFIFMGSQGIGQLVWGISPASVVALPGWTLDMPRARLCRWGVEGEQCRGWQESSAGVRRAVQVGDRRAVQVTGEQCRWVLTEPFRWVLLSCAGAHPQGCTCCQSLGGLYLWWGCALPCPPLRCLF